MAEPYDSLIETLTELKTTLEGIVKLAQEKRRCIIENDTIGLETVVSLEVRALNQLRLYEKKRIALMPRFAELLDVPIGKINVTKLMEKAEPKESETIDALKRDINLLHAEIKKNNEDNKALIEAHLEYTETMMNILVDSEDPLNNFYSGDGTTETDRKKTTGFFDRQI